MDTKITATIKECFEGRTMLVIAHRLSTIMHLSVMLFLPCLVYLSGPSLQPPATKSSLSTPAGSLNKVSNTCGLQCNHYKTADPGQVVRPTSCLMTARRSAPSAWLRVGRSLTSSALWSGRIDRRSAGANISIHGEPALMCCSSAVHRPV